jgi:hypothetical protein
VRLKRVFQGLTADEDDYDDDEDDDDDDDNRVQRQACRGQPEFNAVSNNTQLPSGIPT